MLAKILLLAAGAGVAQAVTVQERKEDFCMMKCYPQAGNCIAECLKVYDSKQGNDLVEELKFEACRPDLPACGYTASTRKQPNVWAECMKAGCMSKILPASGPFTTDESCMFLAQATSANPLLDAVKRCRESPIESAATTEKTMYLSFMAVRVETYQSCGLNANTMTRPQIWQPCASNLIKTILPRQPFTEAVEEVV